MAGSRTGHSCSDILNLLLPTITLLGLMLSLSGCLSSSDCADPLCQSETLIEQWQLDPAGAEAALLEMSDPIVQIAALRALSEHQPAALSSLCSKLSGMPAKECTQLNGRPHLWDSGSSAVSSLPVEGLQSPWASLSPQQATDCSDDSCRLTAALAADDGSGICLSIETARWRHECFFRLAEQARDPADGAHLCLGAGTFVDRCLGHISKHLANDTRALNDPSGWEALTAQIAEISAVLPEPLNARMADRIYAESLLSAYVAATSVTGDPLDHLPEDAHPHIYAAAAHRILTEQSHVGLEAWSAALETTLSLRGSPEKRNTRAGGLSSTWKTLLPGEEALPWVAYLRDQRRVRGSTPESERLIVLLEANARQAVPDQVLLNEAARSSDPRVRWTVARTISPQTSSSSLIAAMRSDRDPLVRQRAQYRKTR